MRRILVADDDLELLFEIVETLEEWGYETETAVNGDELIDALADEEFDLVVTDVSMPWITGLQASHSARYAGLAIPILVITALRDEAITEQVAALGPRTRLLHKPFELDELAAALDSLLGSRASEASVR